MIELREATAADAEGILAVSTRNGFPPFSPGDLEKRWVSHPFRQEFEGVPNGWVLQSEEGTIVGTLSNVHMMYELGGERLKAVAAASWCVDTKYRNFSLRLMNAYFNQKGIQLWINGTAAEITSRLLTAMQVPRIPSPDYDLSLFWITAPRKFAEAALKKKKVPCVPAVAPVAGLAISISNLSAALRRKMPLPVQRFDAFGAEFDKLWQAIRSHGPCLRAIRSSAVLTWRFGEAIREKRAEVYGAMRGSELIGYIVLKQFTRTHLGLRQYVIADLQAMDDDPDILQSLIAKAISATRDAGMAALEWQGWNAAKRRVALALRPRRYRYPIWPLFYKADGPELTNTLADPEAWDFSLFDAF